MNFLKNIGKSKDATKEETKDAIDNNIPLSSQRIGNDEMEEVTNSSFFDRFIKKKQPYATPTGTQADVIPDATPTGTPPNAIPTTLTSMPDDKNLKDVTKSGKKITITFIQDALGKVFIQDYNLCSVGDDELKNLTEDRLILDEKKKTKPDNIKKISGFITYCPVDTSELEEGLGNIKEDLEEKLKQIPSDQLVKNAQKNIQNLQNLQNKMDIVKDATKSPAKGGYDAFKVIPSKKTRKTIKKLHHVTLKKMSKKSRMIF
jgi:ABC-type antimicrobial peptide transport system permease subunit